MTKKKSPSRKREPKYEEIVVDGNKYILHKITWEDITGDSGHANTSETKSMKPAIKITYGFIVEDNDKDLITASTYDTKEDEWSDRNVFPIGCVVTKKKLEIR